MATQHTYTSTTFIFLIALTLLLPTSFFGQSLSLTAIPQWVNIGDLDVPGNQLTVEAMIYITPGGGPNIVSKHTGPPNVNYLLRPGTFELTTTSGFYFMVNPYPYQPNRWYHIAGTYDGSFIRYYVNGCLVVQIPGSGNLFQNDFATSIGSNSSTPEQFLGNIDEVRIWNIVRTQAEIQANMNNLPNTASPGLLAYYKFDGDNINAQGNAALNGTWVGTPSYGLQAAIIVPFSLNSPTVTPSCTNISNGTILINAAPSAGTQYSLDGINFSNTNIYNGLASGNYTSYARSEEGCILTQPVNVINFANPIINVNNPSYCSGDQAVLNASGASTYSWTPATSLSATTGNSVTTTSPGSIQYTVTGTDVNGCSASAVSTVIVNVPQGATITDNNPLCNPNLLNWATWNAINANVATGTVSSLINITLTHSNGGLISTPNMFSGALIPAQYNVPQNGLIVGNQLAGMFTFCYSVPVSNPQIALTSIGNPGNPVQIITSVPYNVVWTGVNMTYQNPINLTGNEGSTIISFPGTHTCISFNYLNTESYCNIAFGVQDTNCQVNPILCNGESINLTALGGINYNWSPSTGISNPTNADIIASPSTTTLYTVIVTDINNCIDSAKVNIIVNPNPIINVNSPTVCLGNPIPALNASGAQNYSWSPAVGLSNTTGPSVTTTTTTTQNYTVIGTLSTGCADTATSTVTINPSADASFTAPISVCLNGGNTALVPSTNAGIWVGTGINSSGVFNPIVAGIGNHLIQYQIAGLCGDTTQQTINVTQNPVINLLNLDTICVGECTTLNATTIADNYSWNPTNGVSNPLILNPNFCPTSTSTYTLTASNIGADMILICSSTQTVLINVGTSPTIQFSINDESACVPFTANLINQTQNVSTGVFTISSNGSTPEATDIEFMVNEPGCYDITYTCEDMLGCESTLTQNDIFCGFAPSVADFTPSPLILSTFETNVIFNNNSMNTNNYIWDFGDDIGTSSVLNPSYNYAEGLPQFYVITLIANNEGNCPDTLTKLVEYRPDIIVYIPNTFTPNGTEINEIFIPVFENPALIINYNFTIFNRWGIAVFQTNDTTVGWNGNIPGGTEISQDNSFIWKLNLTTLNGIGFQKTGVVNLLK